MQESDAVEDDELETMGFEKSISEEVERHYLTLSWYLLNVGWKECVARVQAAVDQAVGGHASIVEIVGNVRKLVELENGKQFRFHTFLLPAEGKESTVLAEGGLSERIIEEPLKRLIDETRDFLEWQGAPANS
ncbi:peroxin [Kappamyces sp. JEL0680]|nr:peroxin [Kappamyces sp. JEL0680]